MCGRWEELAAQQFAALSDGDIARLSIVSAGQSRLADQFTRLEWQWQNISDATEEPPSGDMIRTRQKFVAIVNRMHGINERNAKALLSMVVLGDMFGAMASSSMATYTRAGEMCGKQAALSARLDREG